MENTLRGKTIFCVRGQDTPNNILPQWWIQDFPQVGAPTYDFAKISQKPH